MKKLICLAAVALLFATPFFLMNVYRGPRNAIGDDAIAYKMRQVGEK